MSGSMYDGLDQVVSLVLGPFQPLLSVLPLLASTEELTLPCACVCVCACVRACVTVCVSYHKAMCSLTAQGYLSWRPPTNCDHI